MLVHAVMRKIDLKTSSWKEQIENLSERKRFEAFTNTDKTSNTRHGSIRTQGKNIRAWIQETLFSLIIYINLFANVFVGTFSVGNHGSYNSLFSDAVWCKPLTYCRPSWKSFAGCSVNNIHANKFRSDTSYESIGSTCLKSTATQTFFHLQREFCTFKYIDAKFWINYIREVFVNGHIFFAYSQSNPA